MNDLGVALFALFGVLVVVALMPIFTAWQMYWGYGLEPESWPGVFLPAFCSAAIAGAVKVLAKSKND